MWSSGLKWPKASQEHLNHSWQATEQHSSDGGFSGGSFQSGDIFMMLSFRSHAVLSAPPLHLSPHLRQESHRRGRGAEEGGVRPDEPPVWGALWRGRGAHAHHPAGAVDAAAHEGQRNFPKGDTSWLSFWRRLPLEARQGERMQCWTSLQGGLPDHRVVASVRWASLKNSGVFLLAGDLF